MKTSRRHAIKLGMCATASLATVEGLYDHVAHAAQNPPPPAADGGWLRRDQFETCRGQSVLVRTSSRSITLWLMGVDDVPSAQYTGAVGDPNSFVVLFAAPRSPKLAQGTYWVESRTLGTFLLFLLRVTSFTNNPDRQSAGASIHQLQLALLAGVLYVDGGWQTIVNGLRQAALDGGARVIPDARAIALERSSARTIDGIRLADGTVIRASGVIVTGSPSDVDRLAGTSFASELPPPVRVATLDVALRTLPNPRATLAFGVDQPLYFSVHSAIAKVAPDGGALVHVSKYLPPEEEAGQAVRHELESLMDMMQPGWRSHVVHARFLPSLTVTHTQLPAARRRRRSAAVAGGGVHERLHRE